MRRLLLHALALGVIGAGIVHIAMLLILPAMAERDAWSRLSAGSNPFTVAPYVSDSELAGQAGIADPYFQAVACRFEIADGFAHIYREGQVPFWSASVYDRSGSNIYSLNNRSANQGRLDLVILSPAQMVDMRKSPLEELQDAVFVETPITEGVVVVRGFAPDATWAKFVADYLSSITCEPETGN